MVISVIGDSIPYNSPDDCPDCRGFVDAFAEAVGDEQDREVIVHNDSRHDGAKTQDIADQLADDDPLLDRLKKADIILVSFGFNDQPPYYTGGPPCQNVNETDDEATWVSAIAGTTTECIDSTTASLGTLAATILERVREVSPDADIGVLNSYNAWIGWSGGSAYPDQLGGLATSTAYALESWSTALCAEAERVDAVCVDIYHPFNGDDGLTPAGTLLAADYTHPSQEGNDLIAQVLLESDLGRG